MTATATGRAAETAAAEYLIGRGFVVVERNYRTPRCEIDIVARKGTCLYFVEVKYRATARQGGGLDYITPAKQRQMRFAAAYWISGEGWSGEVCLAAIEVSGPGFLISQFIESII